MKVKKISAANVEACSLPRLFDEEKIEVDLSKEKKIEGISECRDESDRKDH